ncbi:MAG: hypothetical protein M0R05_05585 [Bacilli bacterium]|nr:hypothetical protein [Bacilli bacterium]MDD4076996.1 hypothetical protein [Bacilli bacterium]MDD4387941.1 hypothetical protein [Bacilli bacterium]
MKKVLIATLLLFVLMGLNVKAYTKTGHPDVSEIVFKDKGKLLINMTTSELDKAYTATGKRCFWGWKHHYMNIYCKADYIGEVIFAKINRTSDPIKIDYSLKETDYIERSVKTVGSISGTFSGKIKQIDCKLQGEYRREVTKKTTETTVEDSAFSVVLKPYTRLVYHITGEALVTNGVSKYYVLGILMKKGSWEYIDIITTYYEIYEEEL